MLIAVRRSRDWLNEQRQQKNFLVESSKFISYIFHIIMKGGDKMSKCLFCGKDLIKS